MAAPEWDQGFEMMCDASDFVMGAVLGQRKDKIFRAIYYASRTFNEAQENYSTTEKEMLAIVFACEIQAIHFGIPYYSSHRSCSNQISDVEKGSQTKTDKVGVVTTRV